jgi:hypothetical protein
MGSPLYLVEVVCPIDGSLIACPEFPGLDRAENQQGNDIFTHSFCRRV